MKQKNFSKAGMENTLTTGRLKMRRLIFRPWQKFRSLMQRYPKVSITVMLSVVVINVVLMLTFSGDFKSVPYSFNSSATPLQGAGDDMGIPFSFENYRTMKAIQDTLSWLATKEHRTTADTAVLLRLIEKIEKLDPLFLKR